MTRRIVFSLALVTVLLMASLAVAKKQKPAAVHDQREHAIHALDRLTFGPRPGDVDAVMAMGVDKWIDLQLHPERIDDSAMPARLSGYRTLQMSTREMAMAFPPNAVVKAVMNGKLPMLQDQYERAIYAAAMDRLSEKQKQNATAVPPTYSLRRCPGMKRRAARHAMPLTS